MTDFQNLVVQVEANRHTLKFMVWLIAANFILIGVTLGILFRMHEKNRYRQVEILDMMDSLASLANRLHNYADHTLNVSLDTDHKMDAAKQKLDATPIVVVESEVIKEKIDAVGVKVDGIPARVAEEVTRQSGGDSGTKLPTVSDEAAEEFIRSGGLTSGDKRTVNIDAETVNVSARK
jgi:hypothetical protein